MELVKIKVRDSNPYSSDVGFTITVCKQVLLYVNNVERNTGQQMVHYKCRECKIKYKEFIVDSVIINY